MRTIWRQMLRLRLAKGIVWGEDLSQRHALEKYIIDRVQAGKLRIEQRLINLFSTVTSGFGQHKTKP